MTRPAWLAHRAAGDIVDVQLPAGILRPDVALGQREDGAARDDEEVPQLGEPGDDVVGQAVGQPAADAAVIRVFDKRHDGERSALRAAAPVRQASIGCRIAERRNQAAPIGELRPAAGSRSAAMPRGPARNPDPRLEQPRRRGEMFLACAELAALGQRVEQRHVRARVERRQLEPSFPDAEAPRPIAGRRADELFEHADVAGLKRRRCAISQLLNCGLRSSSSPSRKSPANSSASACSRSRSSVSNPCCGRGRDLDGVDEAIVEVERDRVAGGLDPPAAGFVENAPAC